MIEDDRSGPKASVHPDLPKRFYTSVSIVAAESGFGPGLDGRLPKSPGRSPLIVPTEALAAVLVEEWDAQLEVINHATMPAVRLAFTAIDRVGQVRAAMADEVARYGGSDVICYLADAPADLVDAETRAWAPWIDWADRDLGVRLKAVHGIVHHTQADEAIERLRHLAIRENDFVLSGLAFGAALYGSAVLAFAVWRGVVDGMEALEISRFDENFQIERWGLDDEAAVRRTSMERDAVMLGRWFAALRLKP